MELTLCPWAVRGPPWESELLYPKGANLLCQGCADKVFDHLAPTYNTKRPLTLAIAHHSRATALTQRPPETLKLVSRY